MLFLVIVYDKVNPTQSAEYVFEADCVKNTIYQYNEHVLGITNCKQFSIENLVQVSSNFSCITDSNETQDLLIYKQ